MSTQRVQNVVKEEAGQGQVCQGCVMKLELLQRAESGTSGQERCEDDADRAKELGSERGHLKEEELGTCGGRDN